MDMSSTVPRGPTSVPAEGDDAELDRLLSSLPLPSGDQEALTLNIGIPLVHVAETVGDVAIQDVSTPPLDERGLQMEDEKPIFTALEAELLLASLEDADSTVLPAAASTAEKPKKPKIPTRKRQQQEMEYLRAQVLELEAALSRIKDEHTTGGDTTERSVVSAAQSGELWEQIAKRQMEEKRRAEVENIKLRSMLEGQLRVAHGLEKLLTKRSLTDADPMFDPSKRPRISELPPITSEGPFVPDLDSQLAEIDAVLESSGLTEVVTEIDECQLKTDEKHQIFLERTMTKLLPFPLDQAADSAWRHMTSARLDLSTGYYGTSKRSEDEYNVAFSVRTSVRRASAQCIGEGAGRRQHTLGKRDVIVWQIRAVLNGQAFPDHSLGLADFGYLVLEPVQNADGVPSCILKVCVRIWPQLAESELDKAGLFVDLTLSTFNQNTKTILQMIENDLLERSLTNRT